MVTWYYKRLQGVTGGCNGLQVITTVYRGLQVVTRGYGGLQGVTRGYRGLHGVTRVFRGLQGVTGGFVFFSLLPPFTLSPPPCSNFCAITRLETLATQANMA